MEKSTKRRFFIKAAGFGSIGMAVLSLFPIKIFSGNKITTSEVNPPKVKINPSAVQRNRGAKK